MCHNGLLGSTEQQLSRTMRWHVRASTLRSPAFCNTPCMYCGEHQLAGMVNVVNKRCEVQGCTKRPSVNYPGIRPASRCGEHKLPGMTGKFRQMAATDCSDEIKEKILEKMMLPQKRGEVMKLQRLQLMGETTGHEGKKRAVMLNDQPLTKAGPCPDLPSAAASHNRPSKPATCSASTSANTLPHVKSPVTNITTATSSRATPSCITTTFEQLPSSPFPPTSPSLLQTTPTLLEVTLLRAQVASTLNQNMLLAQAIVRSGFGACFDAGTWPA